jgi:hypothetical protein
MTEQVALLLADVYGMSNQESSERLQMPLSGYGRLLDQARNRMHQCAGGACALVGTSPSDAPDGTPDTDNPGDAAFPDTEAIPMQPIQWKVDEDRLRTLRRELLNGLSL